MTLLEKLSLIFCIAFIFMEIITINILGGKNERLFKNYEYKRIRSFRFKRKSDCAG